MSSASVLSGPSTLSAESFVLALVAETAAGELLQCPFGVVGLGNDVVVGSFFAKDFAARLPGDYLYVLLIDVLVTRSLLFSLVGGYSGHDVLSS